MPTKSKNKKKSGVKNNCLDNEDKNTAGTDPSALFRSYSDFCHIIGIQPHEAVKSALTNEDNPNNGKQIIIGNTVGGRGGKFQSDDHHQSPLGPGGCRALATAILGKCKTNNTPATKSKTEAFTDFSTTNNEIIYTALKEIRIWRSRVMDDGAAAIAEILRLGGAEIQLSFLELVDNGIGVHGARALGVALSCRMNKSLVTLNLDFNSSVGSEGIMALCQGLRTNSTLRKLSVRYCNIGKEGGQPISEMLSFPKLSMNSLDISGNCLEGVGLSSICPGLRCNKSLHNLRLADNHIMSRESDRKALKEFGEVLSNHRYLKSIDLLHNTIGPSGAVALLDGGFSANKKITSFKVDTNLDSELYDVLFRNSADTKGKKKKGGGKKKKKKK